MAEVAAMVFTDPFCGWCWSAEPQLRRLESEFGGEVAITFVLAGLRRELTDGPVLAAEALDAAAASGMPVDPRVFLRDPPSSTYPAGLAVHAVAEQRGGERVGAYLRRLREAILLEGRRMDSAPALLDAARETGGIDVERMRVDVGSSAIVERFAADLERASCAAGGDPDPVTGRVRLPALVASGPGGEHAVRGPAPYDDWRAAVTAAGAVPSAAPPPGPLDALRRFGAMATAEVAAVCGHPPPPAPRAPAALWQAALEWRVRPRRVLGGELWEPA